MSVFSRNDILKHNSKDNFWIIISNNVYDLTDFILKHPGGMDVLLSRAGEDATSHFITKHGRNNAVIRQLESFKIGELPDAEKIPLSDLNEPFLLELVDQCYKEKLYKTPTWFKNRFFWIRTINIIFFFALSILAIYSSLPIYVCVLLTLFQAIIGTSLFGLVAHEETHQSVTKNPFLKTMLKFFWPVFWPFISQNPLRYEHNSHHVKIGDPDYDFEVAGFSPLIRYSEMVPHKSIHKYQHVLATLLYPFYANIITTIGGIKSGYWKKHNREVALEHTISIIVTFTYYLLLPILLKGFSIWYLVLYLTYQCTLFYGIYIGSAINHFIPAVTQPIPDEYKNKYAYYICQNTSNFSVNNPLWYWFSGGFNVQVEHHLIPFVPVENLKKMVPIVKELCKKYNYPYLEYSTFRALWKDHYSYLANLADIRNDEKTYEVNNKLNYQAR